MPSYTVDEAKSKMFDDPREARKEYTRMRDIAEKRIKRMRGTEFEQSKAYREHKSGFKKLKDIDPADLPKALSEISKFLNAKTSTITGQKRAQAKTIKTINKSIGVARKDEGLTKQNYWRFIRIMNEARKMKIVYDSEKMVELAEATLELNDDDFERVLDNLETMLVHSKEVKQNLWEYKAIHKGQDVDIDEFLDEVGW